MKDFPVRASAYLVFAQRQDTRADVDAWDAQAQRFFATTVALASDAPPTATSGAEGVRLVVRPRGEKGGVRCAFARPRDEDDLRLAAAADGGRGLALVARRCPSVWLVVRDEEPDALALRLATVMASVLLGPILDERGPELFGVKTARAKLDALSGQTTRS